MGNLYLHLDFKINLNCILRICIVFVFSVVFLFVLVYAVVFESRAVQCRLVEQVYLSKGLGGFFHGYALTP